MSITMTQGNDGKRGMMSLISCALWPPPSYHLLFHVANRKRKIHRRTAFCMSFDIAITLLLVGLLLEVVEEDGEGAGLLAEVGDDGARRADGLLDVALLVELGEAAPGAEGLGALVQALLETIVDEGLLEDLLEGVQDAHLDLLLDDLDLDLDLGDFFGIGHGFWFGLTLTLAGRFLK